jgi:DNA polymerase III delta prime subunit
MAASAVQIPSLVHNVLQINTEVERILQELAESFSELEIRNVVGFTKNTLGGEFLKMPEDGVFQCFEELRNQGRISSKNIELLGYFADNSSNSTSIKEKIENLNRRRMKDKKYGGAFVGREDDVHAVIDCLTSRTRAVLNLHGEPGVGKTTLAERVADLMVSENMVKHQRRVNLRQIKELRVICLAVLHAFNSPKILKPCPEYVYEVIENLEVNSILIFDNAEELFSQDSSKENEMFFCQLLKGMVEHDKHSKLTILLTSRVPLPDTLSEFSMDYYVQPLKQDSSTKVLDNLNLPLSKKKEISQLCKNKPLNLKLISGVIQEKLLEPDEVHKKLNASPETAISLETSEVTTEEKKGTYSDIYDSNVINEVFNKFTLELNKVAIKLSMFQSPFAVVDAQKMVNRNYSETVFYICTLKNRGFLQERKNEHNQVKYEMHPLINEFLTKKRLEKNYKEVFTEAKELFFGIFCEKSKQLGGYLEKDYMEAYSRIEMERLNLELALQISFEMGFLYFSSDFNDFSIIANLFFILIPGPEREQLFQKWSETAYRKGTSKTNYLGSYHYLTGGRATMVVKLLEKNYLPLPYYEKISATLSKIPCKI